MPRSGERFDRNQDPDRAATSSLAVAYRGLAKLLPERPPAQDEIVKDPEIERAIASLADHRDVRFPHRFPGEELLADAIAHSCGVYTGQQLLRNHPRALRKSWIVDDAAEDNPNGSGRPQQVTHR